MAIVYYRIGETSRGEVSLAPPRVNAWRAAMIGVGVDEMFRIVIILFLVAAIPWAITTWWQMRRSLSPRERAWVGRVSLGLWLGSGKYLWHYYTGAHIVASPMAYAVNGKQYVAIASQSAIFVFALP